MILRTFSWLSVVLLMHTASVLSIRESIIFAAVSKQSDGQKFPHTRSTWILICCVFLACEYGAVVLHLAEQSSARASLCESMRNGEMKYRKTKQNQCNMRKVSWLSFRAAQAIPPKDCQVSVNLRWWAFGETFIGCLKRKSPETYHYLPFIFTAATEGVHSAEGCIKNEQAKCMCAPGRGSMCLHWRREREGESDAPQ